MSAAADQKLRQKQPVGIAAGAEDAKYQAKYKELKRKVKDIEADNDKLHFKVLQAKLTIRRMKMERAILYERLTTIPPSPTLQDRHPLPPMSVLQGGGPVGPPHPALTQLRPPAGGQPQHRDYPFHSSSNVDLDQQRVGGGGPAPHIHPGHHPHHHQQHSSHSRAADPRMNLTPGIDPRSVSVDNQPASSPRLLVHSPPARISEGSIPRQPHHTIPPTSAPYEPRGASNIPHDNHHVHTSPALSHHNTQVGGSHSRKRSHSHSSPRTHQIETHSSTGHIHPAQPYRVLSSGLNNTNNPGHGPGSGTVTPGSLGQQALHQYPENLAPVQPPLNSPPLSEMEYERGERSHHSHPHLHQQLPHQHGHTHGGGGGHQHPHSQLPHHHHVVHHHHQHNHPPSTQAQAHAQNEYGGGLPVGDPPASSSPAIQAHGAGYESTGARGTVSSGPPVAASASGAPPTGSALGPGRTHAHPKDRGVYDYPPTNQPEGRRERDRDRERDGGREGERERDADREWERERDRAREYSRGELINYSPSHHRTRSSQSRPLSRTHSQSHPASGGHSQSQTAASANHTNPNLNPSGEYEHSASNSSRGRTAPSSAVPAPLPGAHAPQTQYHSSPEDQPQAQAYRDYPPDANTTYASRLAPSSRAASPGVPSNAGSGSAVGHTTVAGPDSINSGPRDRDRDREGRERQQTTGPPRIPSPAAVPGSGDNNASDHNNQSQDSGRKRSRNEMELEADEEYLANNDSEGGGKGRRNGASGSGSGREGSLQPQDDSRGAKRYHRQTDSSPERERR